MYGWIGPCGASTVDGWVGSGKDLSGVGEVLGLLFPDDIGGDQGKGAGGVVLWAHVNCRCLRFFEPRLEMLSRCVGQRRGEDMMNGWMD